MAQSKANVTKKSAKRKSSSAGKSSTVRNSPNARKQSPARRAAAPRASARRAKSGQPGRNGVGPRRKRTISAVGFIGEAARKIRCDSGASVRSFATHYTIGKRSISDEELAWADKIIEATGVGMKA